VAARDVEFLATKPLIEDEMVLTVELEQEDDGRWIAEVLELPGVMAYGPSAQEAVAKAKALALRVVADRLEHGEAGPELRDISFKAA
jgi:predicted RNase H-like HicB family nuclease